MRRGWPSNTLGQARSTSRGFVARPCGFVAVAKSGRSTTCCWNWDILRADGKRIVLSNGCFDVIHAGHVAYLKEAKQQGDVLVIGVNADVQVRALKGDDRPIFAETERLEILEELASIDYLVLFNEPTAHELIRAVMPDLYVKGGDYAPGDIAEYDLLQSLGIEVAVLAERPGLGSSALIERIRSIDHR